VLPPQPKKKRSSGGGGSGSSDSSISEEEWNEEVGKGIHVRVPTFLGSVENVFELDQFHKYYGDGDKL
jgi:fructose-1,6-bisphosphatase I